MSAKALSTQGQESPGMAAVLDEAVLEEAVLAETLLAQEVLAEAVLAAVVGREGERRHWQVEKVLVGGRAEGSCAVG